MDNRTRTSIPSIISPEGEQRSTCGYCSNEPGKRSATLSSCSVGVTATQLSCDAYQKMIDRGWRRSGTYVYKPDMRRTCCPQYTIKLDATEFAPSKSQRKLINRWNRHVLHGNDRDDDVAMEDVDTGSVPYTSAAGSSKQPSSKGKGKGKEKGKKREQPFSLTSDIHASEVDFIELSETAHQFEVTLEPSSFTEEKYLLYESYQRNVHNDLRNSRSGFERFLCESPLEPEPIQYSSFKSNDSDGTSRPRGLPANYGSYHQLYRLDGELIAMAVLDILPSCVSSVYFIYDTTWERFSFGKLSALREISLAREIHDAGVPDMKYLYMGFYIHTCQKMRYKGEYAPSYLLDPEEYTWHPLKTCVPLLDRHRYASFSHPEHCLEGKTDPGPLPMHDVPEEELAEMTVYSMLNRQVLSAGDAYELQIPSMRSAFMRAVEGLGPTLSREVFFAL